MNAETRRRPGAGRIALCAAAGLLGIAAPADARDRHTLWTVEGEHNTVYLLGSIHVLRAGDEGLPPVAEDAYDDAEQLVMEIDLDDVVAGDPVELLGAMQRMALLPEGESLRGVLGADYDAINERAREAGLDLALLDRFAPWFVAVTLLQLELAKRGFSPELGVEQMLAARAVADGKPIQGLETAEQQFAVLAGLPMPMQKRFLVMTLEDAAGLDAEIDELMRAWREGDSEALARLLSEEFDEFPELYKPLTEDRNRAWLGQLVGLLDDRDDYLVVVGALHLVGRNSVVDLLRQRGYEVQQR
jgi:uncharacterized protein YbaP (TraB family)